MAKNSSKIAKGIIIAAIASMMWGISGTVLQFISQNQNIPESWFLSARTLGAGIFLMIISSIMYRGKIFHVFKSWKNVCWLFAYAVLGLMANLFTFYKSIQFGGNASAATILQYLSPLFIVLGTIIFKRQMPYKTDVFAFIIALVGVFLALTKGDFSELSITTSSLMWGLGSGLTAAFYVVLPRNIVKDPENPPLVVLGWGTLIAGFFFNLHQPVWVGTPTVTPTLIASMLTVIFLGTIIPFGLLLYATHYAPSDVISIMDAVQPITTSILSVICFKMMVSGIEVIGIILVIISVYILQKGRKNIESAENTHIDI